jgi:hypothetical protein
MAKVIRNMQINITSEDGVAPARCMINYMAGHTDDVSLRKDAWVELPLAGADLTNVQAVFDAALALAESTEGIV